jgi:hypothetical protein
MTKLNKNLILLVFVILIAYFGFNLNSYGVNGKSENIEVAECTFEELELERFLNDMAYTESSNKHNIVSKYGYLGKYQFSLRTLRGIGYNVSKKQFLENPILQDQAMLDLLKYNKNTLQKYINKWDGRIYNDIKITESGILAAAHLAGAASVKNYFRHGINKTDTLGTSINDYMNKFSGYKLEI